MRRFNIGNITKLHIFRSPYFPDLHRIFMILIDPSHRAPPVDFHRLSMTFLAFKRLLYMLIDFSRFHKLPRLISMSQGVIKKDLPTMNLHTVYSTSHRTFHKLSRLLFPHHSCVDNSCDCLAQAFHPHRFCSYVSGCPHVTPG